MLRGVNGGFAQAKGPDLEIRFPDGTLRPVSKFALRAAIEDHTSIIMEGLTIAFYSDFVHFYLGRVHFEAFPEDALLREIATTS